MWRTFPGRRRTDKHIFLAVLVATQDRTVAVSGMLSGERASFFFSSYVQKSLLLGVVLVNKWLCQPWPLDWHSTSVTFLQSLLPRAAKAKPAPAGPPAPASHGWLWSSPAPVRSRPRPHHRPPPWFARHGAALRCCQHGQQPRGIRRWLYMVRMTVGTQQRAQ